MINIHLILNQKKKIILPKKKYVTFILLYMKAKSESIWPKLTIQTVIFV